MITLRLALPLVGSGTEADPLRVPVPTFSGLVTDEQAGTGIATVACEDELQYLALRELVAGTLRDDTGEIGDLRRADPAKVRAVFRATHAEWLERQ